MSEELRQCWRVWPAEISDKTIDRILKEAKAPTCVGQVGAGGYKPEVRRSKVSFLRVPWILDTIYNYVSHANTVAFNVNLYKLADIQYTEYHAEQEGHYGWHSDCSWKRNDGLDRKLSIVIQLSDPSEYEGGSFEFSEVKTPSENLFKPKGSVLVFPSYQYHRVTPVTKGVRKSLVAWFDGPKWV